MKSSGSRDTRGTGPHATVGRTRDGEPWHAHLASKHTHRTGQALARPMGMLAPSLKGGVSPLAPVPQQREPLPCARPCPHLSNMLSSCLWTCSPCKQLTLPRSAAVRICLRLQWKVALARHVPFVVEAEHVEHPTALPGSLHAGTSAPSPPTHPHVQARHQARRTQRAYAHEQPLAWHGTCACPPPPSWAGATGAQAGRQLLLQQLVPPPPPCVHHRRRCCHGMPLPSGQGTAGQGGAGGLRGLA